MVWSLIQFAIHSNYFVVGGKIIKSSKHPYHRVAAAAAAVAPTMAPTMAPTTPMNSLSLNVTIGLIFAKCASPQEATFRVICRRYRHTSKTIWLQWQILLPSLSVNFNVEIIKTKLSIGFCLIRLPQFSWLNVSYCCAKNNGKVTNFLFHTLLA